MLIYLITNNFNDLVYIGQTTKTLEERIYWYKKDIKLKKKVTPIIATMRKYGIDNFNFQIIEDNIENQDILDERERYWIRYYDSNNPEKGYNRDSGGVSGGFKSKETKKLIGETTKDKWANEKTAKRMLEGLRKGTETVKQRAETNFVIAKCLQCGKEIKLKPHQAKDRKFCSNDCLGKYNKITGRTKEASKIAADITHQNNLDRKEIIKKDILDWVSLNKNVVLSCPKNKISTTLEPLFSFIEEKYGVKDFRSLFICFEVSNRKDFLDKLKKFC